jgi:hypothetical protein
MINKQLGNKKMLKYLIIENLNGITLLKTSLEECNDTNEVELLEIKYLDLLLWNHIHLLMEIQSTLIKVKIQRVPIIDNNHPFISI